MSSTISATQPPAIHGHHHHKPSAASTTDDLPGSATGFTPSASAASSTATSGPAAGSPPGAALQKFAAELQSILLGAQAGQATPASTTASNPATASDPAGAVDPSQGGPIRHLADRLQSLLGSDPAASAAGGSAGARPTDVQSVLNTLQQSLQQRLAAYGSQATAASTTALTA